MVQVYLHSLRCACLPWLMDKPSESPAWKQSLICSIAVLRWQYGTRLQTGLMILKLSDNGYILALKTPQMSFTGWSA